MAPEQPITDAVVLIDRDGHVAGCGGAAEQWFGARCTEALGAPLAHLILSPDDPDAPELIRWLRESGDTRSALQLRVRRREGVSVPASLTVLELPGPERPRAALLHDLTAMRALEHEHEARLAAERLAREQAEAEVVRRDHLAALSVRLAEALTPEEVALAMTEEGVTMLGAEAGTLAALSEGAQELEVIASVGYARDTVDLWQRIPLDAPVALADATREGVLTVAESREEFLARWPASDPHPHPGARVTVPLQVDGRTVGAIGLTFADRRRFDAEERRFLELVASHCAQALERARTYQRERHARAEAEAAQQRLEFLADASALLDRSLDPVETLRSLTALCAPRLGELCVVDLLTPQGTISGAVAASAADSAMAAVLERLRADYPLRPDGEHPVARVLRSGQSELLPELTDEVLERIAESDEHLRFMRQVHYRSAIVAPLRARGRTLGTVSVLHVGDGDRYDTRDLKLVEELAARAAMALDNAMLYAEREDDEAAARFLAESTEVLSRSLDYEQTLTGIAELAVPSLADLCAVDVLEGTEVQRLAVAHTGGVDRGVIAAIEAGASRDPSYPAGVAHVLATGRPELHQDVSDALLVTLTQNADDLRAARALGVRSLMIVPMQARGRTIGAVTLLSTESARRYDERDLELALELGHRAALAVDNARLYQHTSHIAVTLQQSLLPPELPHVPGLQLAARYRPTGAGNEVGGDFYDIFGLDEKTWAVVIGDVCGKGADAAALTALARYTIRAVATAETSPSVVLRALNQAILRQNTDLRFCTAVYARVSLGSGWPLLELARAGHPAPLVRRCEEVLPVGGAGQLLGVTADLTLADTSLRLAPGDSLVLYTDGLTDAGAPRRLLDEDDLKELLRQADGSTAVTLARSLEQAAVVGVEDELRDDVAIVVLRVPEVGEGLRECDDGPRQPA